MGSCKPQSCCNHLELPVAAAYLYPISNCFRYDFKYMINGVDLPEFLYFPTAILHLRDAKLRMHCALDLVPTCSAMAVLSDKPVVAATATTANKFHHCFTKSDDDGFFAARAMLALLFTWPPCLYTWPPRNDEELSKLLGAVTIASGGVMPNIHNLLLPKKTGGGELYMWGRDEGDGRLGLGAGSGPNEGGGLRNLTPKLMHCCISLRYFLWWVFHNGNHRRWKALELGRASTGKAMNTDMAPIKRGSSSK
ncbi:hypothetical protein Syun_012564 [Stephania yunnanensis]|uniref:Histone H2A C-terminal domain-containing protein n=1 Tax=Stephania yunnanensis TaxID=152371 RepID=A0AAP0K0F1_9MAGN